MAGWLEGLLDGWPAGCWGSWRPICRMIVANYIYYTSYKIIYVCRFCSRTLHDFWLMLIDLTVHFTLCWMASIFIDYFLLERDVETRARKWPHTEPTAMWQFIFLSLWEHEVTLGQGSPVPKFCKWESKDTLPEMKYFLSQCYGWSYIFAGLGCRTHK